MAEDLTAALQAQNQATWSRAVTHRFVKELFAGSVDDAVMANYLVQDYRFVDSFLVLLGASVCSADNLSSRLRLAQFIGEVAGDENTYFHRAFVALSVTEAQRAQMPNSAATTKFMALFREAAETREYAAIIAVLLVTEWLYLDWAARAPTEKPDNFVYSEWISLHNYPGFHEFVAFLRAELNRVGPAQRALVEDFFARTVAVELEFFDASYDHAMKGLAS